MRWQVSLLAGAQALFQTASVLVMTIGGLAGALVAPTASLATVPIATMFLGTAVGTFPASMWMTRVGRRTGFVVGAVLGVAGGLVSALGMWIESLLVLSLGTFFVGTYQGFAQFYRFAAGEVADDAFRSRAISLVLAGGIVAALAGPALARIGQPIFERDFVGSFVVLAIVSAIAAVLLLGLRMPATHASTDADHVGRPWRAIARQPAYLVALFGASTGYGIMILAMTATPIAMINHDHGLGAASTVIQLHVLGMFLPSFFTGSLIARFGVLRIMFAGVALIALQVLTTLTGNSFASFAAALFLVGVGWNFLYVGGTTLLSTTYSVVERGRAQATNDMSIFAVGLTCSLGAGALLERLGWQTLNLILLPWLALAALALLWLGRRQRNDGGVSV